MQNLQKKIDDYIEKTLISSKIDKIKPCFNIQKITEATRCISREPILDILKGYITSGKLEVIYKVISPDTKTVISEFNKLRDIPETIYDDTSGHEIYIDPLKDIEVVFCVNQK